MQEYNSSTAPPSATICLVHNLAGVVSRDVRYLLCCTWMMYLLCCTWSRRPCAWLRFGRTCSRSRRARTGSCLPVEEKNFLSSLVGAFIAVAAPFFSAVYIYKFIFIYLVTAHDNYSHELVQFGQLGIIPRTKCHLSYLLNVPKSIVYIYIYISWLSELACIYWVNILHLSSEMTTQSLGIPGTSIDCVTIYTSSDWWPRSNQDWSQIVK